jgi:cytoskeletal protein RodZ
LKREREQRGISIDDVALSTKIGTRFLRAMEEEKFDQLPGGIFNRGFVRAYARRVGIDEEQAVADYLEVTGETIPTGQPEDSVPLQAPSQPESKEEKQSSHQHSKQKQSSGSTAEGIPWGVMAMVLLAVALGMSVWSYFTRQVETAKGGVVTAPSTQSARRNSAVRGASQNSRAQQPPSSQNPIASDHPNISTARTSGAPAGSANSGNAVVNATTQPSQPATGTFTVQITAREDSWSSIAVDGKPVFEGTLIAPAEKLLPAQKLVVIRAGNIGGLEFAFNGKKLKPQGDYGEVKTLTFGAGGLQSVQAAPPPN